MTDHEDLILRLYHSTECMAHLPCADMELWNEHSNAVLKAATAIKELVARAEKAEADLAAAQEGLKDVLAHLVAAVSVLEHGGKRGVASDKMFKVMLSDYHKSIERGRAIAAARAEGGKND